MFPDTAKDNNFNSKQISPLLYGKMVDFSFNVKQASVEVGYSIDHKTKAHYDPKCVYWNSTQLDWDDSGCYYTKAKSSLHNTVCQCDHLTNFGIIMGGNAFATGKQKHLEKTSIALSVISATCLLVAIGIIINFDWYEGSPDLKAKKYHIIKLHRNTCIFVGQLIFITVVGLIDYVAEGGCTTITFFTHYIWVAAFSWMGIEAFICLINFHWPYEGYNLELSLPFYLFGYGFPLIISTITISSAYFYANEENKNYYRYLYYEIIN